MSLDYLFEFTPTFWVFSVITVLLGTCYMFIKGKGNKNYPPIYSGWLPWFGCAFELGRCPLEFIEQKRKELGPVYTLFVANERITFLYGKEGYHQFSADSQNIDFQKAVQASVRNVSDMPEEIFYQSHSKIHDMVKGYLAPTKLGPITKTLYAKFAKNFDKLEVTGEGDLMEFVRGIMYPSIMDNFFGDNVLPTENMEDFKKFEKHFVNFDDQFEYGSKLPGFLLRDFSKSKYWLLNYMEKTVAKVRQGPEYQNSQTLFQSLLQQCPGHSATYFALLFLWAALANAIPITFWTLCLILDNPTVLSKLLREIRNAMPASDNDITEEILKKMPYLKSCILEAIRLGSPGVTPRRVVQPFKVNGYTIPKGDLLLLSLFWAHRNEEYFPDPEKYYPERWEAVDLEKNQFLDGFISFGAGRYQCPGRWFALMEIQLFIVILLSRYDCHLNGKIPEHSKLHLVGTQQPVGPCPFSYSASVH